MLSAAVTPESLASNGHTRPEGRGAELWRSLSQSLGVFTAARYTRPSTASGSPGSGRPEPVDRSAKLTVDPELAEGVEGRNGTLDQAALDSALAESEDAVKRLRVRQVLRFGRRKPHAESAGARPTWAR
jgi:hypothetical protein